MEWKKLKVKELEGFIKYNKFGITQREISDKLGVSKNTLVYSIRKEVIKLTVFQDICEILHTNPAVFFNIDKIKNDEESKFGGEPVRGRFVPIEVYEEMKKQMQEEINHLRQLNLEILSLKKEKREIL